MDEVELKLRVDPADVPRVMALPLLSAGGRPTARRIDSVYFDTPDLALQRRAVTLRVRRQGRRFVQTIKAPTDRIGPIAVTGEWETPVSGEQPDLDIIVDPLVRARLGCIAPGDLRPVFASHVKRTVRMLDDPQAQSRIEVAIDEGELRTLDGAIEPISEIELELKSGEPQALYRVALELLAEVPARLERRSKAERGYALATGSVAEFKVHKAPAVDYTTDATVEVVLADALRSTFAHLLANEQAVVEAQDSDGVHQMRVAARRLRSALSLFRGVLPKAPRRALQHELKWLAGELGDARNWDVFFKSVYGPVVDASAKIGGFQPAVETLRALADDARTAARARAVAAVRSPRYTTLILSLGSWIESRGWRDQPLSEKAARLFQPIDGWALPLLRKRHEEMVRQGADFAALEPEHRHEVRISIKKLRYAVEFFRPLLNGKSNRRYLRRLVNLQEALGAGNDVATAQQLLASLEPSGVANGQGPGWQVAGGFILGWHVRGSDALEARLVSDWQALTGSNPFAPAA